MPHPDFDRNVFINCPFDAEYEPIKQAIIFCLVRFGLIPRIATERSNAGETRLEKIASLIEESKYSIHDLSRCQARAAGEHYRLNMPFELGVDFGCKKYAGDPFSDKRILILEEERYRYQAAISDLAGTDIETHGASHETAIRKVRNWLSGQGGFESIGPRKVLSEYEDFQEWYYEQQLEAGFSEDDILDFQTPELLRAMFEWMRSGRPRT